MLSPLISGPTVQVENMLIKNKKHKTIKLQKYINLRISFVNFDSDTELPPCMQTNFWNLKLKRYYNITFYGVIQMKHA